MAIPTFDFTNLKPISRILVDVASHAEFTRLLAQCGIAEQGGNGLDHEAYLRSLITRILGHPAERIGELLP